MIEKAKEECESDFEIMPHQQFVRNFMSVDTPYNSLLLYHELGTGKCHAKDTPILMYDGSMKLVQDIQVNDLLMGDDSTPRTVTSLARGRDKMYDIIPVKGEKYTVNEEHILCLKVSGFPKFRHIRNRPKKSFYFHIQWLENNQFQSRTFRYNEHMDMEESKEKMEHRAHLFFEDIKKNPNTSDTIFEISVKDYLQLSTTKKHLLKGYKVPIEWEEKELPVHPYKIGCWLGDGLYFRNGDENGIISGNGIAIKDEFFHIWKDLNSTTHKHIPMIYKCNSRENRLKLLAGFMDSDGYVDTEYGGFEFTQQNEQLMDDVIYLVRSLGFSCYKKTKKSCNTCHGIQIYNVVYRIHIYGEGMEEIPTLIPRKRSNTRKKVKDALVSGITVEYVKEDEYFGFTLDGNCRYVMGDFTVTHNTCSAIGIAEEMRAYMKQTGQTQKIMIIASPNVQDNFKNQLFNANKLVLDEKNNKWQLNTCIGNTLLKEINPNDTEMMTKEYIETRINALIKKYYTFTGYEAVVSYTTSDRLREINRNNKKMDVRYNNTETAIAKPSTPEIIDLEPVGSDDTEEVKAKKEKTIKRFRKLFDNRLIIVDEVQNMMSRSDKTEYKQCAKILKQIVRFCKYTRFLFLSATPVYNNYDEIIWLANLMNMNDNRALIKKEQVFDKKGDFVKEIRNEKGEVIVEDGRDLLKRKLIGYVSYVRGENPYTFPYRIYPTIFAEKEYLLDTYNYPKKLLNGTDMKEEDKPLMHVMKHVYMNSLEKYQSILYNFVIEDVIKNTKDDKTTFGFEELLKPMNTLNMSYPTNDMDLNDTNYSYKDDSKYLYGKYGLKNCMDYRSDEGRNNKLFDFHYKEWVLQKYGRIFAKDKVRKFSAKIYNICDAIEKSTGIVIIYSRYIEGGLIPMALALEEMGLNRYCSNDNITNFMKKPPSNERPPLDAFTMKPITKESKFWAKYAMITGTSNISPSNNKDIEYICNPNNKDGSRVKVVLISEAGSEGIDFKCVRQVHIMDPWYNMSRVEQIIGRAVRNKSHCSIPFEQRNVEIYMHGTYDPNHSDIETADMYMYRLAETKAIQIGKVNRLLKETAVDCLLNIQQQNFTEKIMNLEADIILSTGKKVKFKIGDKPFSSKCDYMETCEYTCSSASAPATSTANEIDETTYTVSHLSRRRDTIAKRIRQVFRDKVYYKSDELLKEIQVGKPYKFQEIYFLLGEFIKNKEWIVYKGRPGYLVRHDTVYSFQPSEIENTHSSFYERMVPVDSKPHHVNISPIMSQNELQKQPPLLPVQPKSNQTNPPKPVRIEVSPNNSGIIPIVKPAMRRNTNRKQLQADSKPPAAKLSSIIEQANTVKNKDFMDKEEDEEEDYEEDEEDEEDEEEDGNTTIGATLDFNGIKQEIEDVLHYIENNEIKYTEKKSNTIKEHGKMVKMLWVIELEYELSQFYTYITEHLLDNMPFSHKMICIRHFFENEYNLSTTTNKVESMMYKYFEKRILKNKNITAIYLTNDSENELLVLDNNKGWVDGKSRITDLESFMKSDGSKKSLVYDKFWKGDQIKKKTIREVLALKKDGLLTTIGSIVGFVYYDKDKNQTSIKYKNILNARLGKQSGARCTDMELNKTIIPRLNHVLNYLKIKTIKYEKYNIQKNIYCLLYEMILRHTTTINPNEVWFLSPEESIYSDIQNLSFDSDTDDWTKKTKVILDKMK
jgi:hypothetical protein